MSRAGSGSCSRADRADRDGQSRRLRGAEFKLMQEADAARNIQVNTTACGRRCSLGCVCSTDGAAGQGMRPAVVLRGSKESYMAEVSVCYLLHFDRITTAGGAFQ